MRSKGREIFNFRLTYGINVSLWPVFCWKKIVMTEKTKNEWRKKEAPICWHFLSADQLHGLSAIGSW